MTLNLSSKSAKKTSHNGFELLFPFYLFFFRITLFEDPEDDLFDGDLEVNDEELPRLLVDFSIADSPSDSPQEKNGAIFIAASQDLSEQSPSKNNLIDSELEMPESNSPIKQEQEPREHFPRFDTEEENAETDANGSPVTFKPHAITAMQQRLNDYKNQNSLQDFMQSVSFRNDQNAAQRIQTLENPMETYPNEVDDDESLEAPSITSSNGNLGNDDSDYAVKLLKK